MVGKRNNAKSTKSVSKYEGKRTSPLKNSEDVGKGVPPRSRRLREGWEFWDGDAWSPTPSTAFKLFMSARLCAALWSGISDCDETFNYWEPAHYLFKGRGFQTWEYSPVYAIRSYAYILLHVLPLKVIALVATDNSILMFFILRCLLGLACAVSETVLYRGVCEALGPSPGRVTLTLLLFSSGMFISATAFLPSSFSMCLTMAAVGAWLQGRLHLAILAVAASAIVGWPFAGILGIGIAFDAVVLQRRVVYFARWCAIGLAVFLIPLVLADDHYYGRFVVAPLNIVLYNIFSGHGPELYGVEPLSFYMKNGFLNLNVAFVAALGSLPVVLVSSYVLGHNRKKVATAVLTLIPMYLWLLIFFSRPHKEERFLFPVYPLVLVAAALVVDHIQRLFQLMVVKMSGNRIEMPWWLGAWFCLMFAFTSLARILALHKGYGAPLDVYVELHRLGKEDVRFHNLPSDVQINVCVGKEWHRFPSSFFLPGPNWHLQFLQSEFRGQLPKPYDTSESLATRVVPSHMNDLNREEPTRYTSVGRCHFLVDRDSEDWSRMEPRYSDQPQWTVVKSVPFLDPIRSHPVFRAFYIPTLSSQHCVYTNYTLLKNTAKIDKLFKKLRL